MSSKIPIAEGHKMFTRSYTHMDQSVESIIKCNVINLILFAELLPHGEVIVRGSYDLAFCYSFRTNSGELGCVLQQLHKRIEESIDININSEITNQNLQPIVFVKDSPSCTSIIKGTVIETTVQMDIGAKIYTKSSDADSMQIDDHGEGETELSQKRPVESDGQSKNDVMEDRVDEIENVKTDSDTLSKSLNDSIKNQPEPKINNQITLSELNNIFSNEKAEISIRKVKNNENTNEFETLINDLMKKGKEKGKRQRKAGFFAFGGENNIVRGKTRSKSR